MIQLELLSLIGAIGAMIIGGVVLVAFFKSDLAAAIAERIRAGMHRRKHWKGLGGEWIDTPGGPRATSRAWHSSRSRWSSCMARSPSWPSG